MSEVIDKNTELSEFERQNQMKLRAIRMRAFLRQKYQLESEKKSVGDRLKVVQGEVDNMALEISRIANDESMEGMQLLILADATPYPA